MICIYLILLSFASISAFPAVIDERGTVTGGCPIPCTFNLYDQSCLRATGLHLRPRKALKGYWILFLNASIHGDLTVYYSDTDVAWYRIESFNGMVQALPTQDHVQTH